MNNNVYISDNAGNRVAVPGTANPVAASGIVTTLTSAGTNYTITVVEGATYNIVAGKAASDAAGEIISFSITGTAATDANKEWNIGLGQTLIIKIPVGVTTLNVVSTLAATLVYMSRLS
jgi:hypothetical protein